MQPKLFGKANLILKVGQKQFVFATKVPRSAFDDWVRGQRNYPGHVRVDSMNRTFWNFADRWWWDNDGLTVDQVHALLVTRLQREQGKIERAQAMVAAGSTPQRLSRGQIPDDVKQYVFTRDEGRCRSCGSTSELQFDHVVPVALGGSSSADNLQILCGPCNRRKGAGLTVR